MEHKKRLHEEKVTLCWKFEAGICDFGESSCWFSHCQNRKFKKIKIQKQRNLCIGNENISENCRNPTSVRNKS